MVLMALLYTSDPRQLTHQRRRFTSTQFRCGAHKLAQVVGGQMRHQHFAGRTVAIDLRIMVVSLKVWVRSVEAQRISRLTEVGVSLSQANSDELT